MSIKKFLVILLMIATCTLCSCKAEKLYSFYYEKYFSVVSTINIYTSKINEQDVEANIDNILKSVDQKFNVQPRNNAVVTDLMRVNNANGATVTVDKEVIEVLNEAIRISELSIVGGRALFDVTIFPVFELWGFNDSYQMMLDNRKEPPSSEQIEQVLQNVDVTGIELTENTVTLKPGMKLDLGGIAKGYATDKVKDYLNDAGFSNAVIDIGGNIYVLGSSLDNGVWPKVKIRTPYVTMFDPDYEKTKYIGEIDVDNQTIVTSGIYERYIKDSNGKTYHHILDPRTGYPIDNNVISVTVITSSSITADALSTTLFALGLNEGMKLVEATTDLEAIYIIQAEENKEIHISSGLIGNFTFNENVASLAYILK